MRLGARRIAGQHDHKFISAPTANKVAGPSIGLQLDRKLLQKIIACRMTVGVVDLLEAVQIEHQDAECLLALNAPANPLFHTAPIGYVGELIAQTQLLRQI